MSLRIDSDPVQTFAALFELRGNAQTGELTLTSPIGSTLAQLHWSPGEALLRNGGETRRYPSVDALVEAATGAAIPVDALFGWLAGRNQAVAGWRADLADVANGRLQARARVATADGRPAHRIRTRMKALYDLPAPAKLNTVPARHRAARDGYHLLQSAFMLIDWCDTLHVELRRDGTLAREDLGDPLPADDLVLRAARALQALARPGQGAHIAIDKRIPAQAGMGGGSSDAATCLIALNRLWGLRLPLARLEAIGLTLGADVPFFLRGRNAWVEGIGERITPVALPAARFAVIKPPQGLDTRLIFAAPGLQRATAEVAPAIISGFAADARALVDDFGHNDLQPVAQQLCPRRRRCHPVARRQGAQGQDDRFRKCGVRSNAARRVA